MTDPENLCENRLVCHFTYFVKSSKLKEVLLQKDGGKRGEKR